MTSVKDVGLILLMKRSAEKELHYQCLPPPPYNSVDLTSSKCYVSVKPCKNVLLFFSTGFSFTPELQVPDRPKLLKSRS